LSGPPAGKEGSDHPAPRREGSMYIGVGTIVLILIIILLIAFVF
jgi:hypothetical protein